MRSNHDSENEQPQVQAQDVSVEDLRRFPVRPSLHGVNPVISLSTSIDALIDDIRRAFPTHIYAYFPEFKLVGDHTHLNVYHNPPKLSHGMVKHLRDIRRHKMKGEIRALERGDLRHR